MKKCMTGIVYVNDKPINHFKVTNKCEIFYDVAKIFYDKFRNPANVEIEMDGNEIIGAKVLKTYDDDNGKQVKWYWEYTFENVIL